MTARYYPILLAALGAASFALAGVVPPIPRVPASVVAPAELPAEPEDPAAVADRIAQNTKAAGDRLKDNDAGDDTRKTQEQVLKDIDELLKQAENMPPMGGGGGGQNDPSGGPDGGGSSGGKKSGGNSGSSSGPGNPGGSPKGSSGGKSQAGNSGGSPRPGGRRERRQAQGGSAPGKPGGDEKGDGMPPPGDPKPGGNAANGGAGGSTTPALPLDDAITKQVWGHLPERLRQQMTQYYREQFVSKYGELLRDYYSALAEREKAPKK